ncbi:MAG: hypothetical protein AAGJ86_12180, partial [Pseudomonadota bacterium]
MSNNVLVAKQRFAAYREMFYNLDAAQLGSQLDDIMTSDCAIRLAHPLGDLTGPCAFHDQALQPLLTAIPDLERRDYIVVGGERDDRLWIGCGGYYTGVFDRPWLDIPATRHDVIELATELRGVEVVK